MDFLDILHIVSGPVIGAVIGAFTNFIAIKMLFRPLKPVKIGRFTLPFTPGVIPKHQEELAQSLSTMVYQNFFSNSDIEGIFMSDEMADTFSAGICSVLSNAEIKKITSKLSHETELKIKEAVYDKIHMAIVEADISKIIEAQTKTIIKEKTKNGLISGMLLNDSRVSFIAGVIGKEAGKYIQNHDMEIIVPILEQQAEELKQHSVGEAAEGIGIDSDTIHKVLKDGYLDFMSLAKTTIAETFHIKEFLYKKIMDLNPADIERLVNEAIKKEMNYLVYLGGLLGLIIGVINIFI